MRCDGAVLALALVACPACAQPASYADDQSNGAKTVRALLEAVEAQDSAAASALVEPTASLIYEADVGTRLTVESLTRYVMPRLTNCGRRNIRETSVSQGRSVVSVACAEPRARGRLEGRDISFFVRNGKITGANTNDGMMTAAGQING